MGPRAMWWPDDAESLMRLQREIADAEPVPWRPGPGPLRVGGCWVCFPRRLTGRGGAADRAWAAAVTLEGEVLVETHVVTGRTGAPYVPGLLALRMGPLMDRTVRGLGRLDVLLLDATGRDHPRSAGLARHLGAALDLPTIGVTHRPLTAEGTWPENRRGATSPLEVDGTVVACWMRTRPGTRPLVVHPGWAVDLETAVEVVAGTTGQRRTPEPLRRARQLAREARAGRPRVVRPGGQG